MASRALVIAAANYATDSDLQSYQTISQSARVYREVLENDEMWGHDSCEVLDGSDVETVPGVMKALDQTVDATSPEDTLLVVYIGHGQCWDNVDDRRVHFAVGSSYQGKPYTWLSSAHVYRAIRKATARSKVMIADCCYSNELPALGDENPWGRDRLDRRTCVFTATKHMSKASPEACSALPGSLAECTPFSGHVLEVLKEGISDFNSQLSISMLYQAVRNKIMDCPNDHPEPMTVWRNAPDGTPLFTNRMPHKKRPPRREIPGNTNAWTEALKADPPSYCDLLLQEGTRTAGRVVAELCRSDETGREIARQLIRKARETYKSDFYRFWGPVGRVGRA